MAPKAREAREARVGSLVESEEVRERVERRAKKALNFLGVMEGGFLCLMEGRGGERGVALSVEAELA